MRKLFLGVLLTANVLGSTGKDLVDKACKRYKAHDCDLVHAIVFKESSYDTSLKKVLDSNMKYSYGLMQVQCPTARQMGLQHSCEQLGDNLMVGLRFGIAYLDYQLKRYDYNYMLAVAAYNSGSAIVCKEHNPGQCYPGEVWNYDYWDAVRRRYKWLKSLKQEEQVHSSGNLKKSDTSGKCQTPFKWAFPTYSEVTKVSSMVLR